MGDKDDNISIIETRKSKPLKNIKFAFEVNEMARQHGQSTSARSSSGDRPTAPEAWPLAAQGCPLVPGGEPSPLGMPKRGCGGALVPAHKSPIAPPLAI